MLKIVENIATEELLKIYFFKLYARKNEIRLYILEDKLNDILNCKSLSQMNSNELFDCVRIERRGFGIDSSHHSFDEFIPSKFYFLDDIRNENGTIFEHSFLYTNFKLIDGLNLYEAEIGQWNLGCDLINENGVVLKTVAPNLYDNGYYEIKIFPINFPFFLLNEHDENNGDWPTFFSFKDNQLIEIDEVDDKFLILDLINFNCLEILGISSTEVQNDREILLAAVTKKGTALYFASEELRNDREVVFAAVSNDGYAIKYASEELRNDREVVFAAVSNNRYAIKYVGEKLKNDSEILAIANVQKNNNISNSDESIFDDLPF